MGSILVGDNNRAVLLIPRCGSHSLAAAWLEQREPEEHAAWQASQGRHPAKFLRRQVSVWHDLSSYEVAVVLRDPAERIRSACARHGLPLDEQLHQPHYREVPVLPYAHVWRLEEGGLDECAAWLGLSLPLPVEAPATEKPEMSDEQRALARGLRPNEYTMWNERRHCAKPGLGDMVATGLSAVGITKERVQAVANAVGVKDCGCSGRQQRLNELGRKFGIG